MIFAILPSGWLFLGFLEVSRNGRASGQVKVIPSKVCQEMSHLVFRCRYDFGLRRERCARDARALRLNNGTWTVVEGISIEGGPRSGHSLIMVGEDFFGNGGCARRP